jgi:hypothetical protein
MKVLVPVKRGVDGLETDLFTAVLVLVGGL